MKSILTLITVAVLIGLIGAVFYAAYNAIGYLWNLYAGLELVVRVVLISSMSIVLIASFIIAGAIKSAARTNAKNQLMDAKLDLYKSLVALYDLYITSPQQPSLKIKNETLDNLQDLNSEILILASSSVLDINGKLQAALINQETIEKLGGLFKQLIKRIRRDLGHGANYDETKLKFLIAREHINNGDPVEQKVSL